MQEMEPVSVVIPTWNRESTLPRAVDSVLKQTCQPGEIIVIDDGSDDNTPELVSRNYPQIVYIRIDHAGVSAARNRGIQAARYDWIALLDSDDEWHPRKLAIQTEMLAGSPGRLMAHTEEIWIRNGIRINQMKKHRKHGGYIFEYCLPLCVISPSSVLIHRDIFNDIGLFDETFPVCEDYELWLRICCKYPLMFSTQPLTVKYGGHQDQLSKRYWGMDRFRIRAIGNILDNPELSPENRSMATITLHKKINIYLRGAKKHNNNDSTAEFRSLLEKYPLTGS